MIEFKFCCNETCNCEDTSPLEIYVNKYSFNTSGIHVACTINESSPLSVIVVCISDTYLTNAVINSHICPKRNGTNTNKTHIKINKNIKYDIAIDTHLFNHFFSKKEIAASTIIETTYAKNIKKTIFKTL